MIVTNITESLKRISEKYKGWINKIDFYKDGLRALVIFGYPVKLDNDDKHANKLGIHFQHACGKQ